MTLATVGAAKLATLANRRFDQRHVVGEHLDLKVLKKLADRQYLVLFRDARRLVSSAVPLAVGSTVRATVTAVGEKLELRYVGTDAVAVAMEDHEAAGEDALAELAARYSVELRDEDQALIERAQLAVDNPQAMAASGMFLGKLSLPIDGPSLDAVYATQSWKTKIATMPAIDIAGALHDHDGGRHRLATLMGKALDADSAQPTAIDAATAQALMAGAAQWTSSASADSGAQDGSPRRNLAQELLNEQDGSSLAYRYGVLPVLIGDQLMELDLVYFRERTGANPASGLRRLVMTFETQSFGRVEVLAQALGDRLSVAIKSQSVQSSEVLSVHAPAIRDLLDRLGWNVESVSYDASAEVGRAARHVLEHVLNADTLSRLV
jgi:hypothetical protein